MAAELLTYSEAAKHLGITERSVRTYVRKGFLSAKTISNARGKFIPAGEVEELRRLRTENNGAGPVSRQEILLMTARLRRLEFSVQTLLKLLDANTVPLSITTEYGKDLHTACCAQLRLSKWKLEEVEPWVDVFLRIDENDFAVIAAATGDSRPWAPLLRLCVAMSESVVGLAEYAVSLPLQDAHRSLAEGRRRLRAAAVTYEGLRGHVDIHSMLRQEPAVSVVDALDAVLGVKKNK